MPTISVFFGIRIVMNLRNKEHNPPHIHAVMQEFDASFLIADGQILAGQFPQRAKALVQRFISVHRDELMAMWNGAEYKKLPPLE